MLISHHLPAACRRYMLWRSAPPEEALTIGGVAVVLSRGGLFCLRWCGAARPLVPVSYERIGRMYNCQQATTRHRPAIPLWLRGAGPIRAGQRRLFQRGALGDFEFNPPVHTPCIIGVATVQRLKFAIASGGKAVGRQPLVAQKPHHRQGPFGR